MTSPSEKVFWCIKATSLNSVQRFVSYQVTVSNFSFKVNCKFTVVLTQTALRTNYYTTHMQVFNISINSVLQNASGDEKLHFLEPTEKATTQLSKTTPHESIKRSAGLARSSGTLPWPSLSQALPLLPPPHILLKASSTVVLFLISSGLFLLL